MKTKTVLTTLLFLLALCATSFAANPSYTDFDPIYFLKSGNMITLQPGIAGGPTNGITAAQATNISAFQASLATNHLSGPAVQGWVGQVSNKNSYISPSDVWFGGPGTRIMLTNPIITGASGTIGAYQGLTPTIYSTNIDLETGNLFLNAGSVLNFESANLKVPDDTTFTFTSPDGTALIGPFSAGASTYYGFIGPHAGLVPSGAETNAAGSRVAYMSDVGSSSLPTDGLGALTNNGSGTLGWFDYNAVLGLSLSNNVMTASNNVKAEFSPTVTVKMFGVSVDALNIASNTVPTARLGSGVANGTNTLHGDQTWGPIRTNDLSAGAFAWMLTLQSGGSQTPWASDIAGAGFNLSGAGSIGASNLISGLSAIFTNGVTASNFTATGSGPSFSWTNATTHEWGFINNSAIFTTNAVTGIWQYLTNGLTIVSNAVTGDWSTIQPSKFNANGTSPSLMLGSDGTRSNIVYSLSGNSDIRLRAKASTTGEDDMVITNSLGGTGGVVSFGPHDEVIFNGYYVTNIDQSKLISNTNYIASLTIDMSAQSETFTNIAADQTYLGFSNVNPTNFNTKLIHFYNSDSAVHFVTPPAGVITNQVRCACTNARTADLLITIKPLVFTNWDWLAR